MALSLQQFLSILVVLVVALLATWCLGVVAWQFCRWFPSVALWRLRRVTIMVLMAVAAVAAIMAQKDRGSGIPPGMAPQTGTTGVSPVESEIANTLHFAEIVVHTNGTATLSIAWPSTLLPAGATLDLFAATSLVNSVWVWQCEHLVAAGDTNWIATVALPQTSSGTNAPSAFFYVSNRETCAETMADSDGDGLPDVYELAHGTNPYVQDYASASKLTVGPGGNFTDIQSALAASTDYSIIELDPSAQHEITDSLGVQLPQHPVMVTVSNSKTCNIEDVVFLAPTASQSRMIKIEHSFDPARNQYKRGPVSMDSGHPIFFLFGNDLAFLCPTRGFYSDEPGATGFLCVRYFHLIKEVMDFLSDQTGTERQSIQLYDLSVFSTLENIGGVE